MPEMMWGQSLIGLSPRGSMHLERREWEVEIGEVTRWEWGRPGCKGVNFILRALGSLRRL